MDANPRAVWREVMDRLSPEGEIYEIADGASRAEVSERAGRVYDRAETLRARHIAYFHFNTNAAVNRAWTWRGIQEWMLIKDLGIFTAADYRDSEIKYGILDRAGTALLAGKLYFTRKPFDWRGYRTRAERRAHPERQPVKSPARRQRLRAWIVAVLYTIAGRS